MIVEVKNAGLVNVWEESFNDRETGEVVRFYRALLNCPGEPPAQLGVSKEDYETLKAKIGTVGKAAIQIDAQPNRRVRVSLLGID